MYITFANGPNFIRDLKSLDFGSSNRISLFDLDQWTVSFLGISTMSLKRQRLASLFTSHMQLNSMLIGLVRRWGHITASVGL